MRRGCASRRSSRTRLAERPAACLGKSWDRSFSVRRGSWASMVACVACKDRSRSFQTFNESVVSEANCVRQIHSTPASGRAAFELASRDTRHLLLHPLLEPEWNRISGAPRHRRDVVPAMAWRFHAIDATLSPWPRRLDGVESSG